MTDEDRGAFLQAFNRLAVALRLPEREIDASMQQIYFDALADLPIAAVDGAVDGLARTAGYGFPRTSEWHAVAERVQVEQTLRALPPAREEVWHHECGYCEDTGWEERSCDGGRICGRSREHGPHTFTTPCSCRDSNRTYARHHRVPKGREVYS